MHGKALPWQTETMAKGNVRMLTNRGSSYDPAQGGPWRITVNLDPDTAKKLMPVLKKLHPRLAAAGFIAKVIEMIPLSEGEPPIDWSRLEAEITKSIAEAVAASRGHDPLQGVMTE
jgi:hypothetical protein